MTLDELIETFDILDDWSEKYRTIIELGRDLPAFPEDARIDANKVLGCQSQVWLVATHPSGNGEQFHFLADSDAHIVRGLVALVLMIFDRKTASEIATLDPRPIFRRLGLDQHLSQGRTNGLLSMVGRIKQIASAN